MINYDEKLKVGDSVTVILFKEDYERTRPERYLRYRLPIGEEKGQEVACEIVSVDNRKWESPFLLALPLLAGGYTQQNKKRKLSHLISYSLIKKLGCLKFQHSFDWFSRNAMLKKN